MPEACRASPACVAAREQILLQGMGRLCDVVYRGLFGLRLGQAVVRLGGFNEQLISLHDLLFQDVLEIRELLLELRSRESRPELELRYLRAALPDWRLARFLEAETRRHRPDVRGFHVTMEDGGVRIRCSFKGIPVILHTALEVASPQTLRVTLHHPPRLFWIVPVPRSELARVIQSLARGLPTGFLMDITAEGFTLDFSALLAPLNVILNLEHVEVIPGEVRSVAGSLLKEQLLLLPGAAAPMEQSDRERYGDRERMALADEARRIEGYAASHTGIIRPPKDPSEQDTPPPAADARRLLNAQTALGKPSAWEAGADPANELWSRCRGAPLEPGVYRELARHHHGKGQPRAARYAFEALALVRPEDPEAAEYLRASPLQAARKRSFLRPDARLDWLRSPLEKRPLVAGVLTGLVRQLGWTHGPPPPAKALVVDLPSRPRLRSLMEIAAAAFETRVCRLLLHDGKMESMVAAEDYICVTEKVDDMPDPEALFLLARAMSTRALGHLGLQDLDDGRRAVLAGLVHQLGPAWYPGGRSFRPIRDLDCWIDAGAATDFEDACLRLAPDLETELPLWFRGLGLSADRAGLVTCGSLLSAAQALLGEPDDADRRRPLEQRLATHPDHSLRDRLSSLLPFAALEAEAPGR